MVEQLNSFAFEVTRVAREVGTEGKLGGQAEVKGVAGTWKDLTDSVNMMASNLTSQVRGIAKVVTSVATGNLRQKLSINAKGEVAQLTDTINEMIETLAVFGDQVSTVAREVGVNGKLGGQASCTRCIRYLEKSDRKCKSARRKSDNAGTIYFRSSISGNKRRLDADHSGRSKRGGGSIKRYDQPDDRQPERNYIAKPGTRLAEIKPCKIYPDVAGPEGSRYCDETDII
jgi:HAMP domain-containing protein